MAGGLGVRLLGLAACFAALLAGGAGAQEDTVSLYETDFDSAGVQADWTLSGDWRFRANSPCLQPTLGYVSPTTALVFSSTSECAYRNNRIGFATMQVDVHLPINLPTLKVSWWDYVGAETGADFYFVELSTDGGQTWPHEIFRDSVDKNFWDIREIDVTEFVGQDVRLRFGFTSDDTVTNIGWYIDDFRIFGEPLAEGVSALAINDASAIEGDIGLTPMDFVINVDPVNDEDILLEHITIDGTATAGLDYIASSGPVLIPAGSSTHTITVQVQGDAFFEPDETFTLRIFNPSPNAIIAIGEATGTIIDDDPLTCNYTVNFGPPQGSFNWNTGYPPNQDPPNPNCVVSSTNPNCELQLWHIQANSACIPPAEGNGYQSANRALVFNRENTCTYDTVGGVRGVAAMTTGEQIPSLGALSARLSFKHFLEINYSEPQESVTTACVEISTQAGIDGSWETLRCFSPSAPSDQYYRIPWREEVVELNQYLGESVLIRFVFDQPAENARHSARGWYVDDVKICFAPRPAEVSKVTIGDFADLEGNTGTKTFPFPITIEPPNALPISLEYETEKYDGPNPATPDVDFASATGTKQIAAGAANASIGIVVIGDDTPEEDENFYVTIRGASPNVYVVRDRAVGTIIDDDAPSTIDVGVANTGTPLLKEVQETAGTVTFAAVLSEPRTQPITIHYATQNGTALGGPGLDFLHTSGTLTFPANTTTKTFKITILDDDQFEGNEFFNVVITTDSPFAQGTVIPITILDNETGPADGSSDLTINDVTVVEGSCPEISATDPCGVLTQATFTVSLATPNAGDITVDYTTVDGTATAGLDYVPVSGTLTIPAAQTTATVTVDILADREIEGGADREEHFLLVLTNPQGNVNVVQNTGRCTIKDDDYANMVFGVDGNDIILWDLETLVEDDDPVTGAPLALTTTEFRGYAFDQLYGFDANQLVRVNLVTGNYTVIADLSASVTGVLTGLAWDHTTGDAVAVSNGGDVLLIGLTSGTVRSAANLGHAFLAAAVHPSSGRIYGVVRNGADVALHLIHRAIPELGVAMQSEALGTLNGVTPGNPVQDERWDADFNDTTGALILNLYADGGSDPDFWQTRSVQLTPQGTPPTLDTRVISNETPVASIALATPPPPAAVQWTNDLPFDSAAPRGAEFTASTTSNDASRFGGVISGLGDINGDTFEDFAIAAPGNSPGGVSEAGRVYIIFGGPETGFPELVSRFLNEDNTVNADLLDGENGIVINGAAAGMQLGVSVSGVGDMNGDGVGDFAIGYEGADGRGGVFLIYGSRLLPGSFLSSDIGSSSNGALVRGVHIRGASPGDLAGASVASAGDINNNGFMDLIIGAPGFGPTAAPGTGAVYLVTGSDQGIGTSGLINLQSLAPPQGVRILGETAGSGFGASVSGAGDFNGDGIDDFIVGAPNAGNGAGEAIILFGHPDWGTADAPNPINLARLSDGSPNYTPGNPNTVPDSLIFTVNMPVAGGLNELLNPSIILLPPFMPGDLGKIPGMRLSGASGNLGASVAGIGDFNGDGIDDVIVGAPGYDGSQDDEPHFGRAYILLGARGEDHHPESLEENVGDTVPGMVIEGTHVPIGASVAGVGDVNLDGYMDVIVGDASATPGGFSGSAHVIFGSPATGGVQSVRDLALQGPSGSRGLHLYNTASGAKGGFGQTVVMAGDVNNDGVGDILVGRDGGLFLLLGKARQTSATYSNLIRSGFNAVSGGLGNQGGVDLGLTVGRPVGSTGTGKHTVPQSRVSMSFRGGGTGSGQSSPSIQNVTYFQTAAPRIPVGSGPEDADRWVPSGVHWLVLTDRTEFTKSTMEFHYRPEDVEGLNQDKLAIFYAKPGKPLSSTTAWSWLPFVHDTDRRVFTVERSHPNNGQVDVNGYYAIIQADLLTYLGGTIPSVGVTPDTVFPNGPDVVPADKAFWHSGDRRLYAIGEGEVTVRWKNLEGVVVSEVKVLNLWPTDDTGHYQTHIAGTPPVDLNEGGGLSFEYGRITDWDPTFINDSDVDASNIIQDRLFAGRLTRTNDPTNTTAPDNPNVTGRVMIMLSTRPQPEQGAVYFQFIRMKKWNSPQVLQADAGGTPWPVGQYIAAATDPIYAQFHNEAAGSPFVLFGNAPYAPQTDRYPGFYNRAERTGTIVPVNMQRAGESDLVLAFYQLGTRLIEGRTGVRARVGTTSQALATFQWPYASNKYNLFWSPAIDPIVIARQNGSGELDVTAFGQNLDVYVQNDRNLPGFNPNEEHAFIAPFGGGSALFALRNDLNVTGNPLTNANYTSEPYAFLVYDDPNDLMLDGSPRTKTKPYRVVAEEGIYTFGPWPGVPMAEDPFKGEAGAFINPPYPLSIFAYAPENSFTNASSDFVYEDRTDRHWAKSATGDPDRIEMEFYYPAQPDFYFPPSYRAKYPSRNFVPGGDNVPFLDGGPSVSTTHPKRVQYRTQWPVFAPTMKLGEILIEAKFGLPQINGQCSVDLIYMESVVNGQGPSAKLIDPVIAREVDLDELPGDIAQGFRGGEITFSELPPKLDFRVSWDSLRGKLRFKGVHVEPITGFSYVLPNVMNEEERDIILSMSPSNAANTNSDWYKAVDDLYELSKETADILDSSVDPYEMLALTTGDARGVGYVTLSMQNANSCSPLPVSLEIIRVVPEPDPGSIAVVKPACVFDEQLTLTQTLDFGGRPDNFEFEWLYVPDAGGTLPPPPNPSDPTDPWNVPPLNTPTSGVGVNEITIEGPNLLTLTDNWFAVRYRRVGGAFPWGNEFSEWTPVQLAPGWIKRVVGEINPFNQRASGGGIEGAEQSFASFSADAPNTLVSMISQAGPRFTGSVPLNCDNLDAFGLIPIYETVLNRGASLSIDSLSPIDNPGVNTALLLAASRIADLYALLGNEAYADAQDPTIAFGTTDGAYGSEATSIHAFMNQTANLLEEEIALLRGRDNTFAPALNVFPVYNRLYWNFTTDFTGGEVAYALNYNILDDVNNGDGVISEADAARLYPQGHGDAWGHYLTAMKRYYRLLRHPFYTWVPRPEAVLVGGQPVTVDFYDERKFATIAAAKARTGAELVNLIYRQVYVEEPKKQWQGYVDRDADRAWGFGEWAARAGQGAYVDWAVGNALIRAVDPIPTNQGIQRIDRTTVLELNEVASRFTEIQTKNDQADAGLNPLGLGTNVIPFDISPSDIDEGLTHFEQIWARAATALNNAKKTFDNAVNSTQLMRQQNDSNQSFERAARDTELDFNARLIEIFGYPYDDDIGPGGLYDSGYNGPDLFHYMISEPSGLQRDNALRVAPYNVSSSGVTSGNIPSIAESFAANFAAQEEYTVGSGQLVFEVGMRNYGAVSNCPGQYGCLELSGTGGPLSDVPINVKFHMGTNTGFFGIEKPASWTGQRRAPGEIQNARSELIQAVGRFMNAIDDYNGYVDEVEDQVRLVEAQFNVTRQKLVLLSDRGNKRKTLHDQIIALKSVQFGLNTAATIVEKLSEGLAETIPTVTGIIVGFSNGVIIDGLAPVRGGFGLAGTAISEGLKIVANGLELGVTLREQQDARYDDDLAFDTAALEGRFENLQAVIELEKLMRNEVPFRIALHTSHEAVVQAIGNYRKVLAEGQRTMDRREIFRRQTAADVQQQRYRDMAFRIFRNDALQKYRAQFDLAARYTYLAAKAYDYETTMLSGDPLAGNRFLTDIVKARQIGTIEDDEPQTGQGLANALAVMARNFSVLKGQLGFNNPQTETNRFSLRHELFRVLPTSENPNDPTWRNLLKQNYQSAGVGTVANLWDVPEFRRYCVPPDGFGAVEPGIIIPFGTEIMEGRNFFGRSDYGALDSSYDSTQFATKIRSVGVWFSNYDALGLSNTPRVWLVPTGVDYLRSPSSEIGSRRVFNVLDQVLPVPFPIGQNDLLDPNWIPQFDSLSAPMTPMRRHGRLRAYHDSGEFNIGEVQRDSRLIGRSVWNSRWMLIIPASTLSNDRQEGLARFIDGRLVGGARDGNGVSDVKLFFETYAFPRLKSGGAIQE